MAEKKPKVKDEATETPVQTDNRDRKVDGAQWVSQDPEVDYSKVDLA